VGGEDPAALPASRGPLARLLGTRFRGITPLARPSLHLLGHDPDRTEHGLRELWV
jgi:hypothetical protein